MYCCLQWRRRGEGEVTSGHTAKANREWRRGGERHLEQEMKSWFLSNESQDQTRHQLPVTSTHPRGDRAVSTRSHQ